MISTKQGSTASVEIAPESNGPEPGNELIGKKAVLACPSYGPIDPDCVKSVRIAIMHSVSRGLHWVGDASPDRMMFSTARNTVAQFLYENPGEADGVLWIDSDIIVPKEAISRLLTNTVYEPGIDFITGVYHQRLPVHNPVFYNFNHEKKTFQPAEEYPLDTIGAIDGCGFGFVWTSTRVFKAIRELKTFDPKGGWFADKRDVGGFGEDLSFCYQAKLAGIQLWVDTGIIVGHSGEKKVVWREDFIRERDNFRSKPPDPYDVKLWG